MNAILSLILIFGGLAALFFLTIFVLHRIADHHRMMTMVLLHIKIPRKESKEDSEKERETFSAQKNFKEITGIMVQLYESLHSLYSHNWESYFKEQDFISMEYAVIEGQVHFYIAVPHHLTSFIEKQVTSFYPDCHMEEVPDYNIFKEKSEVEGCYMYLDQPYALPFKTHQRMNTDPMNSILNALSKLETDEGAAIQFVLRPVDHWQHHGREVAGERLKNKQHHGFSWYNPIGWFAAFFELFVSSESKEHAPEQNRNTPMLEEEAKAIDEKNSKIGFDTIIRIITSAPSKKTAHMHLEDIHNSFAQFAFPNLNKFRHSRYHSVPALIKSYIYRSPHRNFLQYFRILTGKFKMILCSEELGSLFHFPHIHYNQSSHIAWQNFKIAPVPSNIPAEGLLLGHNTYRGVTKEIRMKREDRFRHFYVIGQTGTGKSSILQVMIRQDFKNGDGCCIIDPHGSLIEDLIPFIPRERADDVIYFNPADMDRPMGLNLLEGGTPEEQELVAMDAMNIMVKLFGEEIFGPRIQDYFRNGCLTLMADPEGGAITDIVRLFTDDDYQKYKVEKVKNPIVRSFWENQMAKTGAREKQEMIPYFAAKFGQFVTNTMMRNIIGQTKSAFNFFDIMQSGKILLMNLSKGETGETNSKLLGMIVVSKLQQAALRRQHVDKKDRKDFFLYIDEFQNYVTDSIEVILSEARKYRLGLCMAHQYLDQLDDKGGGLNKKSSAIKSAVFGNVGSMMAYKIGAQDSEYMGKEFAPVFSQQDLVNLDKFKAVMKLSIDTQPSRPFSITPVNPYTEKGDMQAAEAFKQLSRLKYGRDREFIDREILRRIGVGGGVPGAAEQTMPGSIF